MAMMAVTGEHEAKRKQREAEEAAPRTVTDGHGPGEKSRTDTDRAAREKRRRGEEKKKEKKVPHPTGGAKETEKR